MSISIVVLKYADHFCLIFSEKVVYLNRFEVLNNCVVRECSEHQGWKDRDDFGQTD